MNVIVAVIVLFLFSFCNENGKEFTGGRKYKVESFEEWDERTKNDKLRKMMDSLNLKPKKNRLRRKGKVPEANAGFIIIKNDVEREMTPSEVNAYLNRRHGN